MRVELTIHQDIDPDRSLAWAEQLNRTLALDGTSTPVRFSATRCGHPRLAAARCAHGCWVGLAPSPPPLQHGLVRTAVAAQPKGLRVMMIEAWAPRPGQWGIFLEDDIEVSELVFVFAARLVTAYAPANDPYVRTSPMLRRGWGVAGSHGGLALCPSSSPTPTCF